MKYMLSWKISPSQYKPTVEAFLETGAPDIDGMKTLGRWHALGSATGWHLVEGDDAEVIAHHVAKWAGMVELTVSPVVDDQGAANSLSKVYGK